MLCGQVNNLPGTNNATIFPRVDTDSITALVMNQFLGIGQVEANVIGQDPCSCFPPYASQRLEISLGGRLLDQGDLAICQLVEAVDRCVGTPATVEYRGSGTIVSPCPPNTNACVFSTETLSS